VKTLIAGSRPTSLRLWSGKASVSLTFCMGNPTKIPRDMGNTFFGAFCARFTGAKLAISQFLSTQQFKIKFYLIKSVYSYVQVYIKNY
jgi:hypothetical protein